MRTILDHNPLAASNDPRIAYAPDGVRPIWIAPPDPATPQVVAYRLRFTLDAAATVRVHVSADERYELWLDGARIGRGPERGDVHWWFYESYDLDLAAGDHTFQARVWNLGALGPLAQVSAAPGFLLCADAPFTSQVATGIAAWEYRVIGGYSFDNSLQTSQGAWFVGANQHIDAAAYDWDDDAQNWQPAVARREDGGFPFGIYPAHFLQAATLPAQLATPRQVGTVRWAGTGTWDDPQVVAIPADGSDPTLLRDWQGMVRGDAPVVVPSNTSQHVVLDLEDYYCGYPSMTISGGRGATITVGWAESLYDDVTEYHKGQRDAVDGRSFMALSHDTIVPDGTAHRHLENLWWRAGRFVHFMVRTGDEPLEIETFTVEETRYPLEMESRFASDEPRLDAVLPIMVRVLQMCSHETYMDCPYYEQMMYIGDTRLEALTTYTITHDDRLPRKALTLFGKSRVDSGLLQARYPGRDVQIIAPFTLWWVGMLHDYARWRDDRAFVLALLPGMRATLDAFIQRIGDDGLAYALDGWNFTDWIGHWPAGVPSDAHAGANAIINWQLVYALGLAAELEAWADNPLLSLRYEETRQQLAERLMQVFWDNERGLIADDRDHTEFSEHAQCLALLSGLVPEARRERIGRGLIDDPDLVRTTIYFSHYLFETFRLLGRADALFDRLDLWFGLPAQGFKTTPEMPEPTRSDCHAWGAHPLYHCFATLLGIRPASFGFDTVEITPLPGPLGRLSGSLVHPRGTIDVALEQENGHLRGSITLPDGVTGTYRYGGVEVELASGTTLIDD